MPSISDFQQPYYGLKQQGTSSHPKEVTLIVIAWEPRGKGEPPLSTAALDNLFFGQTNSVAHWFEENSQGRYRLVPHPTNPVIGPFVSVYDWPFYWRSHDPQYVTDRLTPAEWAQNPFKVPPPINDPHYYVDQNGTAWYLSDEGYIHGHPQSWAEAIRMAADQIDFAALDQSGDGNLTTDECLIVIVKAQAETFGTRRPVPGREVPPPSIPLVVDGVSINAPSREICELYAAPPHGSDDLAVGIEEVLHLAANLADQYPDTSLQHPEGNNRKTYDPRRPGQLALTDAGRRPVHIDAYHKLKWGWLNPQLVVQSGSYTLQDAGTTGDALIICNPYFVTNEFYILENRWQGNSYDRYRTNNYGEGLAIWHCIQDPQLSSDWARRAIHLKRVDPRLDANGNIQWDLTLFDGAVPVRSVDLDDDTSPQNLRFQNGIPSRIRLRNISSAGPVMTVEVQIPPPMGNVAYTQGRITMIRVHAHGTGYGPVGHQLQEDCIITLDTEPGTAFGVNLSGTSASTGNKMLEILRKAFKNGQSVNLEYIATSAIGGRVIRVIEMH